MELREVIFNDTNPQFFLHTLHWYFEQVDHDEGTPEKGTVTPLVVRTRQA
jgi:hypothetical protein